MEEIASSLEMGYLIHDLQGDRINTHYQTIPTGADYSGPWPFKYYEGEED